MLLKLENISFRVGKKTILKDVSFSVRPGELVVITGPNGSGKSTLAKLIAGIEQPSSGQILFEGADISAKTCTERAREGIAYSFQQPVHFKGLTVGDLLEVAATGQDSLNGERTRNVADYLEQVGLEPEKYLNREINASLSGGELKRIEIASVIARQAKLFIFDEPEAGIDIWSFNKLINVFKSLHRRKPESAFVIISHQKRIMEQADRIIVIDKGAVARQGKPDKILPEMEAA